VLDFRWKEKVAALAAETDLFRSSFHAMGLGIYSKYPSTILNITQMDTHGNILLHKMDRSDSNEVGYQRSDHSISGDKYPIEIHMPYQDHNREHNCIQVQEHEEVFSALQYNPGTFYSVLPIGKWVRIIVK
jgi:hypothetical protein